MYINTKTNSHPTETNSPAPRALRLPQREGAAGKGRRQARRARAGGGRQGAAGKGGQAREAGAAGKGG